MTQEQKNRRRITGLFVLILVQSFCAVLFVGDVVSDVLDAGGLSKMDPHLVIEFIAALALMLAIYIEAHTMLAMHRQQKQSEQSMRVAHGALQDVIEDYFQTWRLSPAERDVAGFLIKGYSIAEIAGLRKAAEGTVKTQANAVYRKAGLSGRSQLVSLLIEDLLASPLVPEENGRPAPA